jgi:methyl-accepting chemotaxis protein
MLKPTNSTIEEAPIITFWKKLPDVRNLFNFLKGYPCFNNLSSKLDEIGLYTIIISLALLIIVSIILACVSIAILTPILIPIQIGSAIIAALVLCSFSVRYLIFRQKEEKQKLYIQRLNAIDALNAKLLLQINQLAEHTTALNISSLEHTQANQMQKDLLEKQNLSLQNQESAIDTLKNIERAFEETLTQERALIENLKKEVIDFETLVNELKQAPEKFEECHKKFKALEPVVQALENRVEELKKIEERINKLLDRAF